MRPTDLPDRPMGSPLTLGVELPSTANAPDDMAEFGERVVVRLIDTLLGHRARTARNRKGAYRDSSLRLLRPGDGGGGIRVSSERSAARIRVNLAAFGRELRLWRADSSSS